MVRALVAALLPLLSLVVACDPPRTDVPAELAGRWFEGTLSTIQFYDDVTGQWAPTNGAGIYYAFDDDGDYESGGILSITTYGCTSQVFASERGAVEVEGETLRVHRVTGQSHYESNCGDDSDNGLGAETTEYGWAVGEDEYGETTFTLTWPDGEESVFHRWED